MRPHSPTATRAAGLALGLVAAFAAALAGARADDGAPPTAGLRSPGERLRTSSHTVQQVQGAGRRSPLVGAEVVDVTGVVTGVGQASFVLQAPSDDDPGTSDALQVYVGRDFQGMPAVGDDVAVSGKVGEWAGPGGEGHPQTQLEKPVRVRVLERKVALPPAVRVGKSGRAPPVRPIAAADLDTWDPAAHAEDFWESLEHMRVVVDDAVVVGPTAHGTFHVAPEGGAGYPDRTARGGVLLANEQGQPCPGLLVVVPVPGVELPKVAVGDRVGQLEGLLLPDPTTPARLMVRALEGHAKGELPRTPTRLVSDDEHLTVASFNVENFSAVMPDRAQGLARGVVTYLRGPAIVALQEVQDDDGPGPVGSPAHGGQVSAERTLTLLCRAISSQGGPSYRFLDVPPVAHAEGGQPGGNIRVAFLWDPKRVKLDGRGKADALTPNRVRLTGGRARLALNPGRVEPQDPAFAETRRTLAAEFRFNDRTVVVLNSHLSARLQDEPALGPRQPPALRSEPQRLAQAQAVHRFVRELAKDPELTVLHLGDCNDFEFRPALKALAGDALEVLTLRLPPAERYSYLFQGSSQALDHALLGGPLRGQAEGVELEYVRVCAEYPEGDRMSDHDPLVVRLHLPERERQPPR